MKNSGKNRQVVKTASEATPRASGDPKGPPLTPSRLSRFARRLEKAFVIAYFVSFVYVIVLKWIDPPITITQLQSVIAGRGLHRQYVKLKDVSPNFKLAVLVLEDSSFVYHKGLDVNEIKKVIKENMAGKKLKGASTISQQTAKNVFLWQHRDWVRKSLEMYFTMMLELFVGKKRILELYVNVVEMGNGIFGIEAASQYYFHKAAKDLTLEESALIAACPIPVSTHPKR